MGPDVWPRFGLDLDSLRAGFRAVLCPSGGMFVWPMMAICVDYFVDISYAAIGRENQVVFTCF